jgi:hypothetical protein
MPLIQVFKSFSRSIQGNLEKSRWISTEFKGV